MMCLIEKVTPRVVHGVPHREAYSIWVVCGVPHRYAMGGPPSPHTKRITERISARIGSEPGTSGPNPMALFPKF